VSCPSDHTGALVAERGHRSAGYGADTDRGTGTTPRVRLARRPRQPQSAIGGTKSEAPEASAARSVPPRDPHPGGDAGWTVTRCGGAPGRSHHSHRRHRTRWSFLIPASPGGAAPGDLGTGARTRWWADSVGLQRTGVCAYREDTTGSISTALGAPSTSSWTNPHGLSSGSWARPSGPGAGAHSTRVNRARWTMVAGFQGLVVDRFDP